MSEFQEKLHLCALIAMDAITGHKYNNGWPQMQIVDQ